MKNMAAEVRWLSSTLLLSFLIVGAFGEVHKKFEYKHSFKPPYLAQKDGSVPFWEYGGNAIASSENVRIAPSLRSQKGAIWTKHPVSYDWWEVDLVFRITGRGRIGADGLAFWYTSAKGAYNGTVFGSSDQWQGLGIFFDSFDNDNKRNNPYIMAVINDGTQIFDHSNDGSTQLSAGCLRDFRNKPYPTRAKIEYYENTVTLMFHGGMTNSDNDYDICFRIENVFLPKNGYFGVSAATGGLADDHDVLSFIATSLYPAGQNPTGRISAEEEQKLTKEYQEYQQKLELQKEEYRKEHPDEKPHKDNEFEDWFESDNQRELRQIFLGQSQMFEHIREFKGKLDEIIGRQERTLGLVSQIHVGGVQTTGGQQVQGSGQPMQYIDTIRRQEVDVVLNTQQNIMTTVYELKSYLKDVTSKVDNILNNQARGPTAQVQPLGYDYQSFTSEVRDGLNTLKQHVSDTNSKINSAGANCPTGTCLTTTTFLIFLGIQMIILLGYTIYKESREAQAKKFY